MTARSPFLPLSWTLRLGMTWALIGSGPSLQAQSQEAQAFTFSGFGTLALTHNSTDQAQFIRDVGQPKGPHGGTDGGVDSRAGLQANLRLHDQWELVAQAVSSRRFDASFNPELTWAFLKYRASDAVDLRAGRLGFDVYLLADTRNVGYSYLWVRPPVEFFGGIPITSFDGADAVMRTSLGDGFVSFKVFGGQATGRIPSSDTSVFDLKGMPLMGTHVDFHQEIWGFRVVWAQTRFKREFSPAIDTLLASLGDPALAAFSPKPASLADELAITDKWLRYLSLGIDAQQGAFTAQLSLSRSRSQSPALPNSYAGYLLASYRLGAWTPYLNVAAAKTHQEVRDTGLPNVPPFSTLNSGVAYYLNVNQNDQQTLSAGLRWDFHRNLCLKAQVDDIRNKHRTSQLWWHADPQWNGHATVATLALDFIF